MAHPSLEQAKQLARSGRNQEAVLLIQQAAIAGDPDALFMYAEMSWRGGLVEQDVNRARLLYEQAALRGHSRARVYATNLLASGVAGIRDWATAVSQMRSETGLDPLRSAAVTLVDTMEIDSNGNPRRTVEGLPISEKPYVRLFGGLFTKAECDHLIAVAQPGYQPSMIYDDHERLVRDPIRTSDGSAIHWLIEDPAVHAINRRVAAASGTAYENGEPLQSLRYSPGQEYRPHFDFVAGDNRRIWTALIYLNDDYEGGETAFVRVGLRARGRTGDMLLFNNMAEDGDADPLAEHAGLPVTRGAKYLATRWIRERRAIP